MIEWMMNVRKDVPARRRPYQAFIAAVLQSYQERSIVIAGS
ncbi:MAG: hypothetical protein LZF62_480293 [Nitrospira sp.]|nr:MAG: hypothetical protein LZF62_480293 [Nitrospira sp.]